MLTLEVKSEWLLSIKVHFYLSIPNLLGLGNSNASVRNMMCCTVAGQGAGVAAAVSIKQGRTTSEVEIGCVQAELKRQGVRIC